MDSQQTANRMAEPASGHGEVTVSNDTAMDRIYEQRRRESIVANDHALRLHL